MKKKLLLGIATTFLQGSLAMAQIAPTSPNQPIKPAKPSRIDGSGPTDDKKPGAIQLAGLCQCPPPSGVKQHTSCCKKRAVPGPAKLVGLNPPPPRPTPQPKGKKVA